MAPVSRFNLLGRSRNQEMPIWTDDGILPKPRDPKTMSKAERLLGVGDGNSRPVVRKVVAPVKKSNAFATAFSDLRRGLGHSSSNSRSSGSGHGPVSPVVKTVTTDSDSMTSMTSPTFDATNSSSTLPSCHEPPMSPYFSTQNSSDPSSPHYEYDYRQDYHAAIVSSRHKLPFESEMPPISEIYDPRDEARMGLPPLEKPPLDPNPPSTPRSRNSFGHMTRLRSPSSTSVTSESTARAKWHGWKSGRLGRDPTFEPNLSTPAGNPLNNTFTSSAELALPSKHSDAVEAWLARAELERRPSMSSTLTKSTFPSNADMMLSPSSSMLSVRTLTTQKDAILTPMMPPITPATKPSVIRNSKSTNDIVVQLRRDETSPRVNGFRQRNLLKESVMTFSSSEDSDSDTEIWLPSKHASKRVSLVRSATNPKDVSFHVIPNPAGPVENTYVSNVTTQRPSTPERRHKPTQSINKQTSNSRPAVKQKVQFSPVRDRVDSRNSFQSIEWQSADATELGNMCIATVEKIYPAQRTQKPGVQRQSYNSQVSPTSKVMVISKKEEKLLEVMRERKESPRQESKEWSDSTTEAERVVPPIIQVSPPRRKSKKKPRALDGTEEMGRLDEGRVMNFPAPPAARSKGSALSLVNCSSDSDLPEVVGDLHEHDLDETRSEVSLPSIILSPSIDSQQDIYTDKRMKNFSVISESIDTSIDSEPISAVSETIPPVPSIPSELYGSVPDLQEVLHTGLGHRNSGRKRSRTSSSAKPRYVTGLEGGSVNGDADDIGEDINKYVLANMM